MGFLEINGNCQILEKDFPKGIPDDFHQSTLKVINESGTTIALFHTPWFIYERCNYSSPEEYCAHFDQLIVDYSNWDNAGLNPKCQTPEEQVEDYQNILQGLRWDPHLLMRIKLKGYSIKLMGLCRLAYPYHCQVNKVKESLLQIKGGDVDSKTIFDLGDIQVLRKAFELDMIELKSLMDYIVGNSWIYEHPEYWLTEKSIKACVDYAIESKKVELIAFILDYKSKHFPAEGSARLVLTS